MVGRPVQLVVSKGEARPADVILDVKDLVVPSKMHKNNAVKGVSFSVRAGEIVCVAGIDGNGQTELIHGLTGLEKISSGTIELCGHDISRASIRRRSQNLSHIPEDRHKHGLILDFSLEQNLVLQRYREPRFQKGGFIRKDAVRAYSDELIRQYDVRSGQGSVTRVRSMDFSDPYYYASIVTLVKADGKYASATGISGLAGATCTSQISTVWYDTCLPQLKNANILAAQDTTGNMVEAVVQDRIYWPLAEAGFALTMAPMSVL